MTHNFLYEELKLIAARSPATLNNVAAVTPSVDMKLYKRVFAVLSLGDMANETIDFRVETATNTGFTGTVTTRVAAAQLAASASANDNKQIILEIDNDQLGDDTWLRARAITGGATGGQASMLLFGEPFYTKQAHAASVVEIKHV